MKKINLIIILLVSINCFSQNRIVFHDYFLLSYDKNNNVPQWTYYMICKNYISNNDSVDRKNSRFHNEEKLYCQSQDINDYKYSGYDRGHLVPSADFSFNQDAMNETFVMSNMCPQKPSCNRVNWKNIESKVRKITYNKDSLFVISGPVINNDTNLINDKITIPDSFWKIIFDKNYKNCLIWLVPNDSTKEKDFIISLDSLESITNYDFFPHNENIIENDLNYWFN